MGICASKADCVVKHDQSTFCDIQKPEYSVVNLRDVLKIDNEKYSGTNEQALLMIQDICVGIKPNVLALSYGTPLALCLPVLSKDMFEAPRVLHFGYNSIVYRCICKATQRHVVVKEYNVSKMKELEKIHLYREITIHSRIDCNVHVVQFYCAFYQGDNVYLVMEYVNGKTLRDLIRSMSLGVLVNNVIEPLLSTLEMLHKRGILHRDIKPDNIIYGADGFIKLLDFGLATDLNLDIADTRAGTLQYMAPEILMCKSKSAYSVVDEDDDAMPSVSYDTKIDSWAFGVFLYEVLYGKTPFHSNKGDEAVLENIANLKVMFPWRIHPFFEQTIMQCLQWDPDYRPTISELKGAGWKLVAGRNAATMNQLSI